MKRIGIVFIFIIFLLVVITINGSFPSYGVGSKFFDFKYKDISSKRGYTDDPLKLTLDKEGAKSIFFKLRNKTTKTVSLHLYIEDAFPTNNGGIGYPFYSGRSGQHSFGIKTWSYIDKKVIVKPKKSEDLVYTIKVPKTADVGEHISGLIVEDLTNIRRPKKGQLRVAYLSRAAIPAFIKVPGKIRGLLRLRQFKYKKNKQQIDFSVAIFNERNVHLKPKTTIEIINNFTKRHVKTLTGNDLIVLPEQPATTMMIWDNVPVFGRFTVKLLIEYGEGKAIIRYLNIVLFPLYIKIILIALAVSLPVILFALYRKKTKRVKTIQI